MRFSNDLGFKNFLYCRCNEEYSMLSAWNRYF